MSDNYIIVVPTSPNLVPATENIQSAKAIFDKLAPEADEIVIIEREHIQLFDCGANFERISCPQCEANIEIDWWGDTMSADYCETSGFSMKNYSPPCCSANVTMNELRYEPHQAFGRFALSAMNPNIGDLSVEEIEKFEATLGCNVSVVYRHL